MGKKLVIEITVTVFACVSIATISSGAELTIKQERYLYKMPLTENVYSKTFVISPASASTPEKQAADIESPQVNCEPVALFTNPITVYFKIDSAEIDPNQRDIMLSQIREIGVPQDAPLTVTGFTCKMGPIEFNNWLSNERARSVAELLEKEGYRVINIEGRGDSNLVSKHHAPFNRRVEITAGKN